MGRKYSKPFFRRKSSGVVSYEGKERFSSFCLVSKVYCNLGSSELEAARRTIRSSLRRKGTLSICVFASRAYTRKAIQSRIGKGRGKVSGYFCTVRPGQIIFKLFGVNPVRSVEVLLRACSKLSGRFVVRSFLDLFG
jgi:large subunit ribosomal protein L16